MYRILVTLPNGKKRLIIRHTFHGAIEAGARALVEYNVFPDFGTAGNIYFDTVVLNTAVSIEKSLPRISWAETLYGVVGEARED